MAGNRTKGISGRQLLALSLVCLGLSTALYGPGAWLWTLPMCLIALSLSSARRRRRARRAGRRVGRTVRTLNR